MKRILIFSVAYEPFIGGAEIAVRQITDRMSEIEFDMITLNLDGKQKPVEKIGNVTVYRIGRKGKLSKLLYPFTARAKALKLHAEKSYDAMWSIMASFSGFAALFFKWAKPQVKFLLTLQEGDPISYIKRQVWYVYPLFKKIFKKADAIQAISTYLAKWAKDMGARCPITVIPNGVDVSLFTKQIPEAEIDVIKRRIAKDKNDIFLVTTSRLVVKNGIGDVIKALNYVSNNVKFLVLGTGPLQEDLKKLARELVIQKRVLFMGHIEYKDIPKYLAASDIFIRPSVSEGMGNSFIEAMAFGLPVIATPVGGIPDFLKDGETGIFCRVHDPKCIADKIKLITESKELRDHIVRNAQQLAVEKYDWNLVANKMKSGFFATV